MTAPLPRSRELLLELFASYFGRDEVDAVRERLSLTRHGGFAVPEKVLVILFASRSGSNYLGQLLCGTGWFTEIGESFAPHQLEKVRDRKGLADVHEAAQWMIDNRGTRDAFGFKAGFYVLAAAAELGFLPEVIERAQFVLLRRRDRVAQAVSLIKGRLSGRMHSRQPQGQEVSDSDYDAEAIAAQVRKIEKREVQYSDLVAALGKPAPVFYYEDICDDPAAHVEELCSRMGLEMPADYEPEVELSVIRDELNARWVERFRREGAAR